MYSGEYGRESCLCNDLETSLAFRNVTSAAYTVESTDYDRLQGGKIGVIRVLSVEIVVSFRHACEDYGHTSDPAGLLELLFHRRA